jgi:dipeptidyl aminopeptidase/acylaminoacyl peptidase
VRVMPAAGGEVREIFRFTQEGGWTALCWSADGKYLLFTRKSSQDDPKWDLWRVSADGGTPEKLGQLHMFRIWDISAHPDGEQIAIGGVPEQGSAEVWVMENLLSELKAAEP